MEIVDNTETGLIFRITIPQVGDQGRKHLKGPDFFDELNV